MLDWIEWIKTTYLSRNVVNNWNKISWNILYLKMGQLGNSVKQLGNGTAKDTIAMG